LVKLNRRAVQVITAIGINSNFIGFINGTTYKGWFKNFCFPGLNCSSCPGAFGACPLALLQAGISGIINSHFTFFIFGFLAFIGLTIGRFPCGWFCPFGLIQELIYKLPSPKIGLQEKLKRLELIKYLILVVFVLLLPALAAFGTSSTAFCKYICPVEVLEASIPLMISRPSIISTLGTLFYLKLFFLIVIVLLSVFIFKPFCRFFCPLGAIYSLFNSISLYRFQVDKDKCSKCGQCQENCKMGIPVYKEPNNRECMRCNECLVCEAGALHVKRYKKQTEEDVTL